MYNELYAAWRREIDQPSLGALPRDFYARIAEYLKRIREEDRLPDKKSVKVSLLDHEAKNVALMLGELLDARYTKLMKTITQNQTLPADLLTNEEAKMCETIAALSNAYQKFSHDLLQGQISQMPSQAPPPIHQPLQAPYQTPLQSVAAKSEPETSRKRVTLRFTKAIPAIMGVDLKSYGPFKVEDVASLPAENAKVLVKQGLAVQVEVS